MTRAVFDRLRTLRLESESRNGRVEVCQGPDRTCWIKLRVLSPACQRELLSALDETVPLRLESGALELLLPWREGLPLGGWIYEQNPTLAQRRDACLSLLGQQVDLRGKLPPSLTVLSARAENLAVDHPQMSLRHLPSLGAWEPGLGEAQAVCAVAGVISEVLTLRLDRGGRRRLPEEIRLLRRRQKAQDYASWGQLQRDVAAVPDALPPRGQAWRAYARRLEAWIRRQGMRLLGSLALLLAAAALLSLLSVCRQWRREGAASWQGMPLVGDQDLRSGEGGG